MKHTRGRINEAFTAGKCFPMVPRSMIEACSGGSIDPPNMAMISPEMCIRDSTVTGASAYEKEGKLIRFALGRGFSMEEIRLCLDQLKKEGVWNDE